MNKLKLFYLSVLSLTTLFTLTAHAKENTMTALSIKQQQIVLAASSAALGNQSTLRQALTKGLESGTDIEEFKEILVQSYAYCGFPHSLNALATLMQVAEEKNLIKVADLSSLPQERTDSLTQGTQNQTKLVGSPVKGKLFDFAPAIDEYLKAHLFGDIFNRQAVDWQTRELATIAMLASREGVNSQLEAHIEIGRHNGLSDAQIQEILALATRNKAQNVLFGFGQENTAYAKYFIGKSYLSPLTDKGVQMANVTFEPRGRNNWHIHHQGGQILLVVSGRGWYQEWGKKPQSLKAGDVVNIPAGIKHWHGAAKDSWFTHIAVAVPAENASTEWLEAVEDEQYDKLQ